MPVLLPVKTAVSALDKINAGVRQGFPDHVVVSWLPYYKMGSHERNLIITNMNEKNFILKDNDKYMSNIKTGKTNNFWCKIYCDIEGNILLRILVSLLITLFMTVISIFAV